MKVLIVADNSVSAEAIRREMRPTVSFKILGFVDGRRPCAAAVAEAGPDVVMLDDMDSREAALASVREARAGAPHAKIVLLSREHGRWWLAEASRAGIDAAVAKAVRPISLGALVREVVAGNVFQTFAQPRRRGAVGAAGLPASRPASSRSSSSWQAVRPTTASPATCG